MRLTQQKSPAARGLRLPGLFVFATAALISLIGCNAQQPWPLWESYTQHFLDGQGRIIDHSAGDRTTSEGQAYAMFFALVDNDKPHFAKLLDWTEANLAGGDLTAHLPAWNWGKNTSGDWNTLDDNSASDADLWLAYTLIEAGRLWHDPRYDRLGRLLAARIAREEVVLIPGVGTTLSPGPHGFHTNTDTYILNPSYLPLPLLVYMARTIRGGPWSEILESLPRIVNGQNSHGYAMDWVEAGAYGIRPSPAPHEPTAGEREPQPAGSYDAIRVYLWLGIADAGTPSERDLLAQVSGMAAYMRTATTPPIEVDSQGNILHTEGSVGFSAALVPYLDAVGLKAQAKAQEDRLIAARGPTSGLYGRSTEYYDQNLALFSTAWSDRRYRFDRDGKLHLRWK
jgi:endoglucanase